MAESEVTIFREQQALLEQAARNGLHGVQVVASHEIITARMEQGAERILALFKAGREEEAEKLMSRPGWC